MNTTVQSQKGIILKKIPYGDADEIITVLLNEDGIRRFFVPGSRKSKKRFQGLVDYFAHLNFHYRPSTKGLWRVQDVEYLAVINQDVWKSVENFAFGNYAAELICEFTPEAVNDHDLYDFWLDMAKTLTTDHCQLTTYTKYLIRLFRTTGYALELNQCVNCGENQLPKTVIFDHVRGGLICSSCRPTIWDNQRTTLSLDLFHKSEGIPRDQWFQFLKQLTEFSQNIMQKKSKASGFFLSSLQI